MLLEEKIIELKKKHNAIILAHYYQDEEIQDIADFIGDSLELSKKAMETKAEIIVFCGVKFMAEVAKIFNPPKKVLLPDLKAGCSLEESCRKDDFEKFINNYPDHTVITYINCSAEIKALSDIVCTSSSAEKIINKLPNHEKIIFAPDKYLGGYLNKKTGRNMILWNGTCIVHERFSERELIAKIARHKNAYVIAHPECSENILKYADYIGSTSGLLNFTIENKGSEFIVLTEEGIIHQMKKKSPSSVFYAVEGINEGGCVSCNRCPYMQMNTMEKLHRCLEDLSPEISLDEEVIFAARKSLDKMFEILNT